MSRRGETALLSKGQYAYGAPGYGDPSPAIPAGTVVRDDEARHWHYLPTPISDDLLRQGLAAHASCREGLAKRCIAC
jgi:hypothetical protein